MKQTNRKELTVGKHSSQPSFFFFSLGRFEQGRMVRWHSSLPCLSLWDWRTPAPQWLTCWLLRWEVCTALGGWGEKKKSEECCFICLGYLASTQLQQKADSILSIFPTHIPNPQCTQTQRAHGLTTQQTEWCMADMHSTKRALTIVHKYPTAELLEQWIYVNMCVSLDWYVEKKPIVWNVMVLRGPSGGVTGTKTVK